MQASLILWPVLAQVFLTLLMFLLLAARKAKAVKAVWLTVRKGPWNNKSLAG